MRGSWHLKQNHAAVHRGECMLEINKNNTSVRLLPIGDIHTKVFKSISLIWSNLFSSESSLTVDLDCMFP
jgi:hypothetical protein